MNTRLFEQQVELQKREFEFERVNMWVQELRSVGAEYILALTEFLYEAEVFETKYLTYTHEQKINKNNPAGLAYLQLINLSKKCFLKAVEIDLYFESNVEELEIVIQYTDAATDTTNAILREYLSVGSREKLQPIILNKENAVKEIDNKFTVEELDLINGDFKIVYLSILMRKINLELKNIVNKKAA